MILRTASTVDAPGIARVHVRAWRAGYAGLVPAPVLDALDESERERRWRELLGGENDAFTLVVEEGGGIAGFCTVWMDVREVAALYVDPDHWRHGIGGALLDAALERMQGDAALWVFERNDRARGFYATHGFAPDGARTIHEPTGLEEIRLVRR